MSQRRLIIDVKGTNEKDFLIFGYKNFTYEELVSILKKFEIVVESQKKG